MGGCPGWSESSLGAQSFCWFCHEAAQMLQSTLHSKHTHWLIDAGSFVCIAEHRLKQILQRNRNCSQWRLRANGPVRMTTDYKIQTVQRYFNSNLISAMGNNSSRRILIKPWTVCNPEIFTELFPSQLMLTTDVIGLIMNLSFVVARNFNSFTETGIMVYELLVLVTNYDCHPSYCSQTLSSCWTCHKWWQD